MDENENEHSSSQPSVHEGLTWLHPCLARCPHHAKKQEESGVPAHARATWNEVGLLLP